MNSSSQEEGGATSLGVVLNVSCVWRGGAMCQKDIYRHRIIFIIIRYVCIW